MQDDLFSVAGQVVLVSGGSRGIGRALAEGFARRGAAVVITGREQATLDQTARAIAPPGATVRPLVCDVADAAAIQRLVEQVLGEFGRVDTLLNVAGVNKRGVSGVRNPPAVISSMGIAPREPPGDWSEENNPAGLLEDIQRFGAPQTFCMQSVLLE